ncbi:hypothetical protein KY349_02885 [Candidatus Woesearchaeota archaeon]|jgi:hypothetical protein|nr:hypothetical protein [Candidatus Woesearchaeota archaeon]
MSLPAPAKYLADWFVRYTKNRDLTFRKISSIKEEGNKVIVEQKDGKKIHYLAEPFPEDFGKLADSIKEDHKGIVVYNTLDNFESMIKVWKKLAGIPNLTIYFVNPFSKLEKKWIVRPYIHAKISDAESLEQGLNSMYIMVEPISKEDAEKLTS